MAVVVESLFVCYLIWKIESMDREIRGIHKWIEDNFPD